MAKIVLCGVLRATHGKRQIFVVCHPLPLFQVTAGQQSTPGQLFAMGFFLEAHDKDCGHVFILGHMAKMAFVVCSPVRHGTQQRGPLSCARIFAHGKG